MLHVESRLQVVTAVAYPHSDHSALSRSPFSVFGLSLFRSCFSKPSGSLMYSKSLHRVGNSCKGAAPCISAAFGQLCYCFPARTFLTLFSLQWSHARVTLLAVWNVRADFIVKMAGEVQQMNTELKRAAPNSQPSPTRPWRPNLRMVSSQVTCINRG